MHSFIKRFNRCVNASYMKWYNENPNSFVNKLGNNDERKITTINARRWRYCKRN